MSSRRTLILIGAVVIGALAAFVIFSYVSGLEDDVNRGAELVETVQAKGKIERGQDAAGARAANLIGTAKIQKKFRPENAIDSIDEIEGRVASTEIFENTVILDSMFVDAGVTASTFRGRIRNPTYATVTISVDDTNAVAGNLSPGDEVNILVYCEDNCQDQDDQPIIDGLDAAGWLGYRYLYQKAHILALGQTAALDIGEQVAEDDGEKAAKSDANLGLVTFDMPVDGVQLLATVDTKVEFQLYLSLIPQDYEAAPIPFIDVEAFNALPGETGSKLTPFGPEGWKGQ